MVLAGTLAAAAACARGAVTAPSPGGVVNVSTEAQLQDAVRNIASHTTVVLQPGLYRLTRPLSFSGNLTNVGLRGATGNRDDVLLVGPGMRQTGSDVQFGVWTGGGVRGITIANLTIRDVPTHAIVFNPGTERPRISNVRLVDSGDQFIKGNPDPAGGGVDDGVLESSLIEYSTTAPDDYTNGIDIHAGWNWVIRRNTFRNIVPPAGALTGPAVLMWNQAGNTVTDGNHFINCSRGISYGLIDRDGFDHMGGSIRNNVFFRSASQPGDVAIHVADSPDTQILGNLVFVSGTYPTPIEYRFAGARGLVVLDNRLDGTIVARDGATARLGNNQSGITEATFNERLSYLRAFTAPRR